MHEVTVVFVQVLYVPNITQGVLDVLNGRVDVTFTRADLLARFQAQGTLTAADFKTLSPVRLISAQALCTHAHPKQ